jgi:hypothetical protein
MYSRAEQQVPPLRHPGFPVEGVALIIFLRLSNKKQDAQGLKAQIFVGPQWPD